MCCHDTRAASDAVMTDFDTLLCDHPIVEAGRLVGRELAGLSAVYHIPGSACEAFQSSKSLVIQIREKQSLSVTLLTSTADL